MSINYILICEIWCKNIYGFYRQPSAGSADINVAACLHLELKESQFQVKDKKKSKDIIFPFQVQRHSSLTPFHICSQTWRTLSEESFPRESSSIIT